MESDDLTAKLHESVRDWEVTKTPMEQLQCEVAALKARIEELERQVAQRNTMNAAHG